MMDATRGWTPWSSGGVSGTISTGASRRDRSWDGGDRIGDLDLASTCTGNDDAPAGTTCGMKSSSKRAGGGGSRQGPGAMVAGVATVAGAGRGSWRGWAGDGSRDILFLSMSKVTTVQKQEDKCRVREQQYVSPCMYKCINIGIQQILQDKKEKYGRGQFRTPVLHLQKDMPGQMGTSSTISHKLACFTSRLHASFTGHKNI